MQEIIKKLIKVPVKELNKELIKNPEVSVIIQTYNHEKYIKQCIEGVLMQKTNFPYEILIGEDDSIDNTRNICIEYANKEPKLIGLTLHSRENVIFVNNKPTGRFNSFYNFSRSRGKYIAICEGDDFWTDKYKLQKQYDYLEHNIDVSGCFHNSIVVDGNNSKISEEWYDKRKQEKNSFKEKFTQKDCLTALGSSYPSCSLMFRRDIFNDIPDWFLQTYSDFTLDLLITQNGFLSYLPFNASAYRIHSGGIWQGVNQKDKHKIMLERLKILYQSHELRNKYADILKRRIIKDISIIEELERAENKRNLKIVHFIKFSKHTNANDIDFLNETLKRARIFFSENADIELYAFNFNNQNLLDKETQFNFINEELNSVSLFLKFISRIESDYIILTIDNSLIQPFFYSTVYNYIKKKYDSLVINSRQLQKKYLKVGQISEMYSEVGIRNNLSDCFIFKKELIEHFIFNDIKFSNKNFYDIFLINLMYFSNKFFWDTFANLLFIKVENKSGRRNYFYSTENKKFVTIINQIFEKQVFFHQKIKRKILQRILNNNDNYIQPKKNQTLSIIEKQLNTYYEQEVYRSLKEFSYQNFDNIMIEKEKPKKTKKSYFRKILKRIIKA